MKPIHQTENEYDKICSWCTMPPKLIGDIVFLTAFDLSMTDDFMRFMTDETTGMGLGDPMIRAYTRPEEKEILSNRTCNYEEGYDFAIWDKEDRRVIGSCSLYDIHPVHRTASLEIGIGDRAYRNAGRGTDAIRCLLSFAFDTLGMHNIALRVYAFNENAVACYKKCGFKEYGRRRESKFVHGERWDEILMDITHDDYISLNKKPN